MKAFYLIFFFMLSYGCGSGDDTITQVPQYPPGCDENGCDPGPDPDPDPGNRISYQEMQGHLNTFCASCHPNDAFMSSERALRQSSVFDRLFNRSMPPQNASRALPESIRVKMTNFFR